MKPKISKVISCFVLISFLSGCVTTSRYIETPSAPKSDLGISSRDGNLEVVLNYLIVPNGEGAWIKGARWDEYVLTIRNISDKPLTVEKIRLIDPRGIYVDSGINPEQLETVSETLAKEYKDMGIAVAPGLIYGAAVATGVLVPVGIGAAILAPVALIGGGLWYLAKKQSDIKDMESIDKEFKRRALTTPTLSANATLTGSAFFPIVPNPKALAVDYRIGTEVKMLDVSLEKLKGLHITSDKEKEKK